MEISLENLYVDIDTDDDDNDYDRRPRIEQGQIAEPLITKTLPKMEPIMIGILQNMIESLNYYSTVVTGCCNCITEASSSSIRIFLNPQLFLSRYKNFHVHTSTRIRICPSTRIRIQSSTQGTTSSPGLFPQKIGGKSPGDEVAQGILATKLRKDG